MWLTFIKHSDYYLLSYTEFKNRFPILVKISGIGFSTDMELRMEGRGMIRLLTDLKETLEGLKESKEIVNWGLYVMYWWKVWQHHSLIIWKIERTPNDLWMKWFPCKILEHQLKDFSLATNYVLQAKAQLLTLTAILSREKLANYLQDLKKRDARISRKIISGKAQISTNR